MWIFWAFQMTPEQVRIQFVFIKLAHIDEGYFCLNNSSGYLTCDILSFFTLFLYLNQPKNDGYKVQVEQAFLHFFINKKYFDRFNFFSKLCGCVFYVLQLYQNKEQKPLSGFSGTRYIIPMCKPINLFSGMPVSNTMIRH